MTELSGTLEGVGLPAIVRFLARLKKTGRLVIIHEYWRGEIVLDAGLVTGASLGSRAGLPALDALVQALPGGRFTFDGIAGAAAPNISLRPDALEAHLDKLVAEAANGTPGLPSLESVPVVVGQEQADTAEEQLPLDRGMLQTLMAVDGQRTVGEIVAQRGSFDALWQLAELAEVGLVRLGVPASAVGPRALARGATIGAAPLPLDTPTVESPPPATAPPVESVVNASPPPATAPPVESVVNASPPPASEPVATDRHTCPKLGFEDDPHNSFGRPTRLHRCFATGTPLPLSLDQQRQLCLSDEFGTCPRLSLSQPGGAAPAAREPTLPRTASRVRGGPAQRGRPWPERPHPNTDDDRRVTRLPVATRADAAQRGGGADASSLGASASAPALNGGLGESRGRPTPWRARPERSHASELTGRLPEPLAGQGVELRSSEPRGPVAAGVQPATERRIGGLVLPASMPLPAMAGGVVMIVGVLALLGFLFAPQLGSLLGDDSLESSALPNGSAVLAGTPVAQLTSPRATPLVVARPTTVGGASVNPTGVSSAASAASPVSAPVQATLLPASAQAATTSVASASPTVPPRADTAVAGALFDERFANNARNWPSSPQGTAFVTDGSYRLSPRQAGQFVAIGAPIVDALQDVVVTATFQKLGGPAGGGYGIILRDQSATPQDGTTQNGRYYVLEAGDRGEVGIWRRDTDHWVDLLPWQHTDAVRAGNALNELSVRVVGDRLSMAVNGTEVANRTDATFTTGGVGLFAGGDGNQVAVTHFVVQTP